MKSPIPSGGHKYLLTRMDGDFWRLPGGSVEDGETLLHAAVRELAEETGLIVQPDELTYLFTMTPHIVRHAVFSLDLGDRQPVADNEIVELAWCSGVPRTRDQRQMPIDLEPITAPVGPSRGDKKQKPVAYSSLAIISMAEFIHDNEY